jgi:DNA processing protein
VAVVGARNASHGGLEIAGKIGRELAENGIGVISGLARGVDIASQRGVLTVAGGRTYGVMGCGIDLCYPAEHIESYMMMQEYGGIISEYCPGVAPIPGNFPMRNRLISGLADGVLVVEAGSKSGSLITAELAMEQGKDVFVVPGDIYKSSYAGSNHLIQNGAALVTGTRDIMDALGIFMDEDVSGHKKKCEVMLETAEKIVYSYLGLEPIQVSEISRMSGYSLPRTMELLLSMELKGVVKQIGNQYYAIVL